MNSFLFVLEALGRVRISTFSGVINAVPPSKLLFSLTLPRDFFFLTPLLLLKLDLILVEAPKRF